MIRKRGIWRGFWAGVQEYDDYDWSERRRHGRHHFIRHETIFWSITMVPCVLVVLWLVSGFALGDALTAHGIAFAYVIVVLGIGASYLGAMHEWETREARFRKKHGLPPEHEEPRT